MATSVPLIGLAEADERLVPPPGGKGSPLLRRLLAGLAGRAPGGR